MKHITNFLPLSIAFIVISLLSYSLSKMDFMDGKSYIYLLSKQKLYLDSSKELDLQELKGNYFVIHIFASWCGVCKEDYPLLKKIKEQTNIPIIGIMVNSEGSELRKNNLPYDMVAIDRDNNINNLLNSRMLPETIIINPEGVVVSRYLGSLSSEEVEQIVIPAIKLNQ